MIGPLITDGFGTFAGKRFLPISGFYSSTAWILASSVQKTATAGFPTSVTTATVDTRGADLIVAILTDQNDLDVAFSDSQTNTWSTAVSPTPGNLEDNTILYSRSPTTSSIHTFTYPSDGLGNNPTCVVAAFKGALLAGAILDQTNEFDTALGVTTAQPGSITPTVNGELIISGITHAVASATPNVLDIIANIASGTFNLGTGVGWTQQAAKAAINPTWTMNVASGVTVTIASFKGANAPIVTRIMVPINLLLHTVN